MSLEQTREIANKLVEYCNTNNTQACLDELYHQDAISIEAMAGPGSDSPETKGLDGIRGKHEWWYNSFEVHSANTEGPFMHGDNRFGVIFEFDATNKETNERTAMKELAIYTVENGKIVQEEFYYN